MNPELKVFIKRTFEAVPLGLFALGMMLTPAIADADGGAGAVTDRTRPTIVGADGFAGEQHPYHNTVYRWTGDNDSYVIRGERAAKKAAHEGVGLGQGPIKPAQTRDGKIYESFAVFTGRDYREETYLVGTEKEGKFLQVILYER